MALIIPVIFVVIIIVAAAKKVNVFSSFCAGAEDGMKFALSLLPLLACVFMMCNLFETDSYISRCACTIYASSETVFYVFAIYFSKSRRRPPALPLAIVLVSAFLSTVISCLLCRFM